MNATDALKKIMKEKGVTNANLAKKLECSNAVVYERLTQENIGVKNFVRMLELLDYELIVQPRALGRRPKGCIVIDNSPKINKNNESV
ncbi:hypothetical protein CCDG5_0653 [[Clostridium] cellulosi]|uniref:HTH cro/C1-type domain-containing protein n=1 Tax=[Clostridium] cellulosi TaxID=29343 RepID=A0A078KMU1_9FIRM|nr:hypothetical protein CCDG5_0653 [[Clostridium] cellulosi]